MNTYALWALTAGVVVLVAVGLTSCSEPATVTMNVVQTLSNSRIQVTRLGVFEDNIAYGGRRGIYLIKDNETGQEFLGVSGIGINTLGAHGKHNSVKDER